MVEKRRRRYAGTRRCTNEAREEEFILVGRDVTLRHQPRGARRQMGGDSLAWRVGGVEVVV